MTSHERGGGGAEQKEAERQAMLEAEILKMEQEEAERQAMLKAKILKMEQEEAERQAMLKAKILPLLINDDPSYELTDPNTQIIRLGSKHPYEIETESDDNSTPKEELL
jgi:replicative DNA helicase